MGTTEAAKILISIHALREEGDAHFDHHLRLDLKFLSTPSARRATVWLARYPRDKSNFYPRPPRGGRPGRCTARPCDWNFYPRPPRGGRRSKQRNYGLSEPFLSTPSARRATPLFLWYLGCKTFLSTPSARRATLDKSRAVLTVQDFYPRPPRGGRPYTVEDMLSLIHI